MKIPNYILIIIYATIVGFGILYLPIIYVVFFIVSTFFLYKFELFFLLTCFGFLFISIMFSKTLIGNSIIFLMFVLSYFLSGRRLKRRDSLWRDNLGKIVLLYFIYELIQLIISANDMTSYQTSRMVVQISILMGMFYFCSYYSSKLYQVYYVIGILLICALSESILAILQHFSPNFYITSTNIPRNPYELLPREYLGYILPSISKYIREARGTFGQLNGLGSFLTFFVPLSFALASVKEANFKKRMIFGVIAITIFLGLYFSYSRGSLFGSLAGLILMVLLLFKKHIRIEYMIAVIPLVLALTLIIFQEISAYIIEYWDSTQNFTLRLQYWGETLAVITESPSVFLFGTNYFSTSDPKLFVMRTPFGHNSYLAIWETRGIIGLLLIILLLVFSIKNFYFSYKRLENVYIKHISLGLMAGLVAFSISQLFDHKLAYFFNIRSYFFIILGTSIGIKSIAHTHKTESVCAHNSDLKK